MNNILITSAGRRVSLVKAFKQEIKAKAANSKVFVSDASPLLSSAAQVADSYFDTFLLSDERYIEDLLNKCIQNNIVLIIPTIDTELIVLAQNKERFLNHNISIVISDEYFIEIAESKLKSTVFFEKYNLESPQVYQKDDYKLPMFVKPINGSNSVDNYIVKTENQVLDYFFKNDSLYFFEYLDHDLYDEYTCDLYYSKDSELKCVIPRKRIEVRGGEVSKGITKKNRIKKFVEDNFASIKGARGCITLQLFMHKETEALKGIEINPRFGGGYPLSYLAGGNYPKWILEEYIYNETLEYHHDWEDNLLMLRYDDEVLVHGYEG
ncbi:ATP-grasp domain-containing protein [Flaviramulus aquimarinus]|uniref:ATP-grasp domain-containing protein n=1 Tax=Flaviramulus aquimarinus TaxID=1170456 RepID=A0ABP9FBK9_9FLAO